MNKQLFFKKFDSKKVQLLILVLVFLFIQTPNIWFNLKQWYSHTLGARNIKYGKISSLKSGQDIEFFKGQIGSPRVTHNTKVGDHSYVENIFVDEDYFLTTLSDEQGQVKFFSIITRGVDFNPRFKLPALTKGLKELLLGKTTFTELDYATDLQKIKFQDDFNDPVNGLHDAYNYNVGARSFDYYERYYLGFIGDYKTFFFGFNDKGAGFPGIDVYEKSNFDPSEEKLRIFRFLTSINTYAEADFVFGNLPNNFYLSPSVDSALIGSYE